MRVQFPDYRTIPSWPREGVSWIHPDDITTVTRLVPSQRVFRRDRFDGVYYHYAYGKIKFRTVPIMSLPVSYEGFDLGDAVEVIGVGLSLEPLIGRIVEMQHVRSASETRYTLEYRGVRYHRYFVASQMKSLSQHPDRKPSLVRR